MDFQAIRKEYENEGIDESQMSGHPIELLRTWCDLAIEKCPGKWFEPNVMALATSDLDGNVSNRFVLLKGIEANGIRFFTNYESHKGNQLAVNSKSAVAFHWPYLGRQIRIEGLAEKTSREVSENYFHSRPRGSQIGAAASLQSSVVRSRQELEEQRKSLESKFEGRAVPLPENWGGYLLKPTKIEFWQGRLDRLHDRLVFSLGDDNEWMRSRLSP